MPVVAAEIEISLQAYEPQTKDGECWYVFALCLWEAHLYSCVSDCHCRKELDIATNGFLRASVSIVASP